MYNYFECKIRYEKLDDNGVMKAVMEIYLVKAASHAEAENRIIEEMKPYVSGEVIVEGVKKLKIAELLDNENGDRWYKVKIAFISVDEEKQTEKRTAQQFYVKADDIKDAVTEVENNLKETEKMSDYEITAVIETAVIDVYDYKENVGNAFYDDDAEEEK